MEVTRDKWQDDQENAKGAKAAEKIEERIGILEEAIATLESLEMELEQ